MYNFTSKVLADAIIKKFKEGLDIRIITHISNLKHFNSNLIVAGIPVIIMEGKIMHMKLVILDERIVGTGSFNWTKNAINSNYENFVLTDSPKIVEEHLSFFD